MSCFKKPLSPPLKKIFRNYFHFMYREFLQKTRGKEKKKDIKIPGKLGELASLFAFNTLILPLM